MLLVSTGAPGLAEARELLPDLDQAVPRDASITARGAGGERSFHLGFESAVDNIGAGPLLLDAQRASTAEAEMGVRQVVEETDGSSTVYPTRGRVAYVRGGGHEHWHYLGFDRYELRRVGDYGLAVPDAKTGFCLGDRYETRAGSLPGEPERPVLTTNCGLDRPDLLSFRQGISVGYGDNYPPFLEGQSLDVTGVRAGRYLLVHRVNGDRSLRESSRRNNASSLLISIGPVAGGARRLAVIASCPDAEGCPLTLTGPAARRAAGAAVRRRLGRSGSLTLSCSRISRIRALCRATHAAEGRRRTLTVSVRNVFANRRQRTLTRVG